MACERIFAVFLAIVLCIAAIEGSAIARKRSSQVFSEGEVSQITSEKLNSVDLANSLMMKMIDAVIEYMQERGASTEEVSDLMRKRSGIRKCFFHAVNCW